MVAAENYYYTLRNEIVMLFILCNFVVVHLLQLLIFYIKNNKVSLESANSEKFQGYKTQKIQTNTTISTNHTQRILRHAQ